MLAGVFLHTLTDVRLSALIQTFTFLGHAVFTLSEKLRFIITINFKFAAEYF